MSTLTPVFNRYNARDKSISFGKPPKTITKSYKEQVANIPKLLERLKEDVFDKNPKDTKYEVKVYGETVEDMTAKDFKGFLDRKLRLMQQQPEVKPLVEPVVEELGFATGEEVEEMSKIIAAKQEEEAAEAAAGGAGEAAAGGAGEEKGAEDEDEDERTRREVEEEVEARARGEMERTTGTQTETKTAEVGVGARPETAEAGVGGKATMTRTLPTQTGAAVSTAETQTRPMKPTRPPPRPTKGAATQTRRLVEDAGTQEPEAAPDVGGVDVSSAGSLYSSQSSAPGSLYSSQSSASDVSAPSFGGRGPPPPPSTSGSGSDSGSGSGSVPMSEPAAKKALGQNNQPALDPSTDIKLIGPDSAKEMKKANVIYKEAFRMVFNDRSGVRELERFRAGEESKAAESKTPDALYNEAEDIRRVYEDQMKIARLVYTVVDDKKDLKAQWDELNVLAIGSNENLKGKPNQDILGQFNSVGVVVDISNLGMNLQDFMNYINARNLTNKTNKQKGNNKLSGFMKGVNLEDIEPSEVEQKAVEPIPTEQATKDPAQKVAVIGKPEFITNERVKGFVNVDGFKKPNKKDKSKRVIIML